MAKKETGFQAALAKLNATGIMRNLDDKDDIQVIPSGCPTLDFVTDVGGFPRGRIIEISGDESSGKCVALDSPVHVPDRGILSMKELLAEAEFPENCDGRVADSAVPFPTKIHAAGGPAAVVAAYNAGRGPMKRVRTEFGNDHKTTPSHRLLTITPTGIARWTLMNDLRPKMTLVSAVGQMAGKPGTSTAKELAQARLYGAFAGAETRHGVPTLMMLSKPAHKAVRGWADGVTEDKPLERPGPWTGFTGMLRIRRRAFPLISDAIGPYLEKIRVAPVDQQAAWVVGLWSTKGTPTTAGEIELEIEEEEVANTMQMVMRNLGIPVSKWWTTNTFGEARMKLSVSTWTGREMLDDTIKADGQQVPNSWARFPFPEDPEDNHPFLKRALDAAWTCLSKAQDQGAKVDPKAIDADDTSKEGLEKAANLMRPYARSKRDQRVLETLDLMSQPGIGFDRVIGTEAIEDEEAVDVHVPIGSHYAASGLVNHNSTLAMHLCAQVLDNDPNAVCVYMDYERSTARKYAAQMGLIKHVPRFLLLDPDTLQQAEQITNMFQDTEVSPAIVVCDSIPAMVPQEMFSLDPEKDSKQIGIQARLLSDMLGRWVKYAHMYDTLFILINQLRTYISTDKFDKQKGIHGVAGSQKQTTAGGRAVAFYASMRLRLQVKKQIKAEVRNPMTGDLEEIPVANFVKAVAYKNKVGSPFKSGAFYIEFGKGLDAQRTIHELAVAQGVVTKKHGGHFSYVMPDGTKHYKQGEEAWISHLKDPVNAPLVRQLAADLNLENADAALSTPLGFVQTDMETGETQRAGEDDLDPAEIEDMLESLQEAKTVCEQADAVGLLVRKKGRIELTVAGATHTSKTPAQLEKKLNATEKEALEKDVQSRARSLRELLVGGEEEGPDEPVTQPEQDASDTNDGA